MRNAPWCAVRRSLNVAGWYPTIIMKTTNSERDTRSGRFLSGCKPGPGRQVGSRNRLSEAFIEDLKTVWEEDGIAALRCCARDDATGFCRIIAGLMPKDVNLNLDVTVSAIDFAQTFRQAVALLGNEAPPSVVRTIEHSNVRKRGRGRLHRGAMVSG